MNMMLFSEKMDAEMIEERPKKYMEQYLHKKEANGKWIEYWVVCRGYYLLFYATKCDTEELRDSFRGSIELTPGSKCIIGKRKKYSFPFFLSTSKARYYFKSQTLLLRHQWIHAIELSLKGALPESPPTALPLPSTLHREASPEEDTSSIDLNSNDSTNELIADESDTLHAEDYCDDETDNPSNVILVTSPPAGESEIRNFFSGERTPDTSNYLVTNFLNSRNVDIAKKGIDNLSFEEEDCSQTKPVIMKHTYTRPDERNMKGKNKSSLPGNPTPKFSMTSPRGSLLESSMPNRAIRSAGSVRGSSTGLLGSSSSVNGNGILAVNPQSSSLSLSSNRFSRHLVSSAPDLKAFTRSGHS